MIHRQAAEISTSVQPGTPSSFSDSEHVVAGELVRWWGICTNVEMESVI